jgi:hypothetical protein
MLLLDEFKIPAEKKLELLKTHCCEVYESCLEILIGTVISKDLLN